MSEADVGVHVEDVCVGEVPASSPPAPAGLQSRPLGRPDGFRDDYWHDADENTHHQGIGYRQPEISVDVKEDHSYQSLSMEPSIGLLEVFQEEI